MLVLRRVYGWFEWAHVCARQARTHTDISKKILCVSCRLTSACVPFFLQIRRQMGRLTDRHRQTQIQIQIQIYNTCK